MKLHKLVLIGFVIIFAGSLALPTGSFACWVLGDYSYECCFVCCRTEDDCTNRQNSSGVSADCTFNWYCIFNPMYCLNLDTCDQEYCSLETALNSDQTKIETLRRFRDEVLAKTPVGREYIRLYYQWSPAIVQAMEEDEELKAEVKELIEELLPLIEKTLQ